MAADHQASEKFMAEIIPFKQKWLLNHLVQDGQMVRSACIKARLHGPWFLVFYKKWPNQKKATATTVLLRSF